MVLWKHFLVVIGLFVVYITPANSQNITIYTDSYEKGNSTVVEISKKCVTSLDPEFDLAITSVDPNGQCVHLYEEQRCQGSYFRIDPKTPAKNDLQTFSDFNDRTRSIGPCHSNKCHEDYVQKAPSVNITIQLFDHEKYKGGLSTLTLSHGSCSSFPPKIRGRLTSILLSSEVCIELHSEWNCTGDSMRLASGSKWLENLVYWAFNDVAKSVSFCGLNCDLQPRVEKSALLEDSQPPGPRFVTIFSELEFNGPFKHIDLGKDDGHCVEIPEEWQGEPKSIKTYGNCINVYKLPGCLKTDENMEIGNSISDLSTLKIDFSQRIRSIDSCRSKRDRLERYVEEINNASKIYGSSQENKSHNNNNLITTLIVGGLALAIILILVGWLYIIRTRSGHGRSENILTDQEIQVFLNGYEGTLVPLEDGGDAVEYAYSLPYNKKYEIPRELISIDNNKPLGHGHYAIVYRGSIQDPVTGAKINAAVKTVRQHSGDEYLRALLKEIKTMSYVGDHPHTVKLLGCCTQDLKNELLVLTELYENGSMDKFLQKCRPSFLNLVAKGQILELSECQKLFRSCKRLNVSNTFNFDTFHLLNWSYQIADGMEFLTSKKVIHGDLASRNVLLDFTYQVKIGDFGLSKQLYEYTQYVKQQQVLLPWRWSSIDILTKLEFSTESDIWAYGITLWEIFSLGDTPYPGSVWGPDFLNSLKDGLRPSKPNFATSDCYNLMLDCWREEPKDRISFHVLKEKLADQIQALCNQKSLCQSGIFNADQEGYTEMEEIQNMGKNKNCL